MSFKKIIKGLGEVGAKTLVAGLSIGGGPVGALAGSVLGEVFDIDENDKEFTQKVEARLGTEEGQLLAKEAEYRFRLQSQAQLNERDIALLDKAVKALESDERDRASARVMYQQTGDQTPKVLTYFICFVWLCMGVAFFLWEVPEANRELIIRMQGQLEGALATAIAFWLGSSAGSKLKTDVMAKELAEDTMVLIAAFSAYTIWAEDIFMWI